MPLSLNSVQGYVQDIRTLLLDRTKPYRYSDISVVAALNFALQEGSRVRPDLFLRRGRIRLQQFEDVSGEQVDIEQPFRLAFVYGTAAHVLLRDEEDVQDDRANTFLTKFHDVLTGVRPAAIAGGTPPIAKK